MHRRLAPAAAPCLISLGFIDEIIGWRAFHAMVFENRDVIMRCFPVHARILPYSLDAAQKYIVNDGDALYFIRALALKVYFIS